MLESSRASHNDYNKLLELCNSYGLNQSQTNQLINEFQKGILFAEEDSLNEDSFQNQFVHKGEEYSFKQQQFHQSANFEKQQVSHQCLENEEDSYKQQYKPNCSYDHAKQNQTLQKQLYEKQKLIVDLMEMKKQDHQIICGLKDALTNLTGLLRSKQNSFKELHLKYTSQVEHRLKESNSQTSSKRTSTEGEDNAMKRTQSKGSKDCNQNFKDKRSNRIDMKKYRQMIENLRNNY